MLNASPSKLSKEPRPVYAAELDVLGFDRYWQYEPQLDAPYLWAEANAYYYRGVLVAKLRGGDVYTAPEIDLMKDEEGTPLLPKSTVLHPVDIGRMVEKNRELLGLVEQTTAKKIVAVYEKYQKKLDCFHVAFSGGKDSCVLLDLVKKALPQGSFVVVFGDTGMEFPDTYALVDAVEADCKREGIPFYRAKSHFTPQESWKLFGPPSRTLRWCCSVHKSTPQTLKLREILNQKNYIGLDFVGVRADESAKRSTYKYEGFGKKQKGQFSHNSILEWSSAEIWLYIYANKLKINVAYKKGNSRAGCLCCPMSGGLSGFFRKASYQKEIKPYFDTIQNSYEGKRKKAESYLKKGGWNVRKNGRDLRDNASHCIEIYDKGKLHIYIKRPASNWLEWAKTIGEVLNNKEYYSIQYEKENIPFILKQTEEGFNVTISESIVKDKPKFVKLFRQIFRKGAYCSACRVCETNCRHGCISFVNGNVKIEGCVRCHECHEIDSGCLLFHSLRHPQGGGRILKSLNSFADHAPKPEWLQSFFDLKEDFFTKHSLGPNMYDMFRRFLRDAELNEKNHFTKLAKLISDMGWDSEASQGIILLNLVLKNPQMAWYIINFDLDRIYPRSTVEDMLMARDVKPKDAKSIVKAYKRIVATPLGTVLNFGHVTEKGELVRTKCVLSDPRVLLYGLFKFAEKCGDYKGFTLSTLLNDTIDRDGISPTRIFGLTREEAKPMLRGLSARYPKFIDAAFTHDLEKITLSADKSSADVLTLFEGEEA